jgi:hypothetical protein
MKSREYFFIALIILLGIIIYFKGCGDNNVEPKVEYKYKTEYVKVEVPFEVIKGIKTKTPPKMVIKWKKLPVPYKVEVIPDSLKLLIKNLEDSLNSVLIDKSFLTHFPKASKLISFNLKYDTLNITTLNINGETKSNIYPMDFDNYKYQWYDNKLHHEDYDKVSDKNFDRWKQLYLQGGYDFIQQAPLIDLNYNISIKRVKVSAGTTMHLTTDPFITGTAKIWFRLFK